jgi:hypothetical protein
MWYKLKGKKITVCDVKDIDYKNTSIIREVLENITISTVFLSLDHNHSGVGKPVLFETMVFGGEHDQYQERYCTWNEAAKGHKRIVNMVRKSLKNK